MNPCIEYDLESIREQAMYADEPVSLPPRYSVVGVSLIWERGNVCEETILETDDLSLARIVADLENNCAGPNGWDAAVVWDQHHGREVPYIRLLQGGKGR